MSRWQKKYKFTAENIVPVHPEATLRTWIARAKAQPGYCRPEQFERYKTELIAIERLKAQGLPVPEYRFTATPAPVPTTKTARRYREVMPPGYLD